MRGLKPIRLHCLLPGHAAKALSILMILILSQLGCQGGAGIGRSLSVVPAGGERQSAPELPSDRYSPAGSQTLDSSNHLVSGCANDSDSPTSTVRVQLISQDATGPSLGPEEIRGESVANAASCGGHGFQFSVPEGLRNSNQVFWVKAFSIDENGSESAQRPPVPLGANLRYAAPPDPGQGLITTFERQGEFMVSDTSNHNFNINLPMANGTQVGRMELDFDVYVSNWDPTNPGGYHCLFWLQKGTWGGRWKWDGHNVGYMNLRGPAYNGGRIVLETTTNGHINVGRRYSAETAKQYHLKYTFEPSIGRISYRWTKGGVVEYEESFPNGNYSVTPQALTVENGGFFVQFGTQIAPEGPEAKTYGWRFSNFVLKVYR